MADPIHTKARIGSVRRLKLSLDNVTFTEVSEVVSSSLDQTDSEVAANSNLDADNEQVIPGRSKNGLTFNCNTVHDDPGQMLYRTAKASKVPVYFKYLPIPEIGKKLFSGIGLPLKATDSSQDNSPQTTDMMISVSGRVAGDQLVAWSDRQGVQHPADPVIQLSDLE
jgi:hypothetical protein